VGQTVSKATTPKQQLVNDWRNGVRFPQILTGTLACAANSANGFTVGTVSGGDIGSVYSIQSVNGVAGTSGLAIASSGSFTAAVTVSNSAALPAAGTMNIVIRDTNAAYPSPGYLDSTLSLTVTAALNNTHAYRYYRLQIDSPQSSNGDVWVTNMEIRALPGGADTANGHVTATALDHETTNVPANAFDNLPTTWSSASNPTWLQADYGATSSNWVAANEFLLTVPGSTRGPVNFRFQGSDDGSTFMDLKTVSGRTNTTAEASWTANASQTFTV
jgi:hypothetical protein